MIQRCKSLHTTLQYMLLNEAKIALFDLNMTLVEKDRNSSWMTSVDKQILQPWYLCAWPLKGAWQPPKVPCRWQKEGRLVVRDRQRLVFPAEYIMVTYRGWELEVTTRLQSYWRCTTITGLYINSTAKSDFRGLSISGMYHPVPLVAVCFKFAQFPNLPLCKISI